MQKAPAAPVSRRSTHAQLRPIALRIRRHWAGETTVWEALTQCVVIMALPLCVGFGLAMVIAFLSRFPSVMPEAVLSAGAAVSLIAVVWWCKGMYALSNQLLSQQRLFAAFIVFVLPCPVAWQWASVWSVEFIRSVDHDLTLNATQQKQAKAWEHRPVNVVALPEQNRIVLSGDMGWGSANALKEAIPNNPKITLVELESSGGWVHEANLLVDIIQQHHMDTLVRGRCASACTDVFLAGTRRFVGPDARFGFHQSGFDGRAHNTEWSIAEYESCILFRSQGVTPDFTDAALNATYYAMWWPDVAEAKQAGFATQWWSERPKEYD